MALTDYNSRTSLVKIMKDVYAPRIVKQFYNATPAASRLKKATPDDIEFRGKAIIIPVKKGWSEGVGARLEGDDLPASRPPRVDQMTANVALNYGRTKITRVSMKATRDAGAWERALDFTLEDVRENLQWDGARQRIRGTGTGTLSQANGAGSTATSLIVDDPFCFKEGMVIDIYTAESGGSQEVDSIEITNINGNTLTLASAQSWSDNSYIFREDARGKEITGMRAAMDDGTLVATYQGINRTSNGNGWLKANVMGNSGTPRPLTTSLVNQAMVKSLQAGRGEGPSAIYSNYNQLLRYVDLQAADKRYMDKKVFDGGWEAVMVTGPSGTAPWFGDGMIPSGEVWFPYEKDMRQAILSPLEWVDEDGKPLSRVPNKDEFEAYMAEYANIVSYRCNRNTVLKDLIDP